MGQNRALWSISHARGMGCFSKNAWWRKASRVFLVAESTTAVVFVHDFLSCNLGSSGFRRPCPTRAGDQGRHRRGRARPACAVALDRACPEAGALPTPEPRRPTSTAGFAPRASQFFSVDFLSGLRRCAKRDARCGRPFDDRLVRFARFARAYASTTMAAGSFTRRAAVSMMRNVWLKSASSR